MAAAQVSGASSPRILARHVLPNVFAPITVLATVEFASWILLEATLSFLGLGVQPPFPSWGRMLSDGRTYLLTAWWLGVFPGIAIMIAVLGGNLLGNGLRDALDPHIKSGNRALQAEKEGLMMGYGGVDVDRAGAVALLQELVRLDTTNPPGRESLAANVLDARLQPQGFTVERTAAEPGRDCLIATLPGTGDGPTLIFNGHTDVQPAGTGWTRDPFGAEIEGDRLYGRGAMDMKAGVAAFVLAAEQFAMREPRLRGTLVLQAVADKVSGGFKGTGHLVALGKAHGNFAVVCEPTGIDVYVAHRGEIWFEVMIRGRSAHSGRPWMGVNAIAKAAAVVQALSTELASVFAARTHPMLPSPSINFGTIEGGQKENLVAGECRLTFDRRMIPGESFNQAEEEIRRVIEQVRAADTESWSYDLRRTIAIPPLEVDPNELIVRACQQAYRKMTGEESREGCTSGFEDAHVLALEAGIPTAMFGPYVAKRWTGANRYNTQSGTSEEYVDIPQFLVAIQVYARLIENLLA